MSMLAFRYHGDAVHDDVIHACAVFARFRKICVDSKIVKVKYVDIGVFSFGEEAAVLKHIVLCGN